MKFFAAYKTPILLSLVALVTTFAALKITDRVFLMVGIPAPAFTFIPLVASATTFIFSALGIYLLAKKNFSPLMAALCGFLLGAAAYLCFAIASILLALTPASYDHILLNLIAMGFILGGFLAPIFGAFFGYWLAKKQPRN